MSSSSLAKRIAVSVVGGTITLAGVAMIVLPGPALLVIPIGLSILATEFVWARRYLRRGRMAAARWKERMQSPAKAGSACAAADLAKAVGARRAPTSPQL